MVGSLPSSHLPLKSFWKNYEETNQSKIRISDSAYSCQQNDQIRACVLFLTPIRFGTKGEFGELAELFEEGITNGGVQSLNKSEGQRQDNQGTLFGQWWEVWFFQILDG